MRKRLRKSGQGFVNSVGSFEEPRSVKLLGSVHGERLKDFYNCSRLCDRQEEIYRAF